MCYVIENFNHQLPSLKWSLRYRAIFFFRNSHRFTTLLFNLVYSNPFATKDQFYAQTQLPYIKYFFKRMFFSLPYRLNRRFHSPIVLNLSKSLQYWALQNSLQKLSQVEWTPTVTKVRQVTNVRLTYRYYVPKQLISLHLNQQPYRTVLLNLLKFLLTWWPQFNTYKKLPHSSSLTTSSYNVLRYYNQYFFKIYTL